MRGQSTGPNFTNVRRKQILILFERRRCASVLQSKHTLKNAQSARQKNKGRLGAVGASNERKLLKSNRPQLQIFVFPKHVFVESRLTRLPARSKLPRVI